MIYRDFVIFKIIIEYDLNYTITLILYLIKIIIYN